MTAPKDGSQRVSLDNANINTLSAQLRMLGIGSLLQGQIPQVRRRVSMPAAAADKYNLATLAVLVLPEGGKASSILRCDVRAGASSKTGPFTVDAYGTTPLTKHVAVTPNGNIAMLGTDAVTDCDISYIPERGDVVEGVFPVASDTIALPAAWTTRGVVLLLEAESLVGTLVSKLIVLAPAGSPSTGQIALDVAKANVSFASADAVTRARIRMLITTKEDLCTVLESAAQTM